MTPIFLLICLPGISTIGELSKETHKTAGASQQKNELSCYTCDSLDNSGCLNLTALEPQDKTLLLKKCKNEQRVCKRECTQKCEAGCIVIGERTKLYSCTTCCTKTGCNDGSSGQQLVATDGILLMLLSLVLYYSRL